MPTPNAFQIIEKKTLGSSSAGLSFQSIPSNFTHLIFSIDFPPSGVNNYATKAYFNNDTTGSNYTCQRIFENGNTVTADRVTSNFLTGGWTLGAGGGMSTYQTLTTMFFYIPNYKSTNMYKTAFIRVADIQGGYHGAVSAVWASNSAINRFDFDSTTTQYPAGTSASLYGVL